MENEFTEIKVELIDRPETGVRLSIDPAEVDELAQSIRQQGLLQPIVLNKKKGRYEIVAGDRRFLAVQALRRKTISARIVEMSELEVDLARGAENLQRRDLTPYEEGHIYVNLSVKHNMTNDQIGKKMGKSPGVVKRRMDILGMPDSFQRAIHLGKVSVSVAEELLGCSDSAHREYLIEMAIEHGITKEVGRMWVQDWKKGLRRSAEDGGNGGSRKSVMEPEIFYRSCDACRGAVDLNKVQEFRVCPECYKLIADAILKAGPNDTKDS